MEKALAPITRKQAVYLLKTIWPNVPDNEVVKAAMMCQQYNLNPLMKQIYIIPFKAKTGSTTYATVLGIGASRAIAQQKGHKYSYIDGPRIMTEEEQVIILGEADPRMLWALTRIADKEGNEYPGYGCWPRDTDVHGHDKGNTKRNMAFIRSERNALDRMAPGTLPDIEIMDEAYSPVHFSAEVQEGKQDFIAATQGDIDNYWPGETKPEIDMVWLKESLMDLRDTKPLVYNEFGKWIKQALGDKHPATWSEAINALSTEKAAEFVAMVQRGLEL